MWIRAGFITNHKMKTSLFGAKFGHLVIVWRAYQRIGGFSNFFIGNHWVDARLAVHDGIGLQCLQCVKVFRCRQPRNGQTIVAGCRVWAQLLCDLLAFVNLSMRWCLHSLLHLIHFFSLMTCAYLLCLRAFSLTLYLAFYRTFFTRHIYDNLYIYIFDLIWHYF